MRIDPARDFPALLMSVENPGRYVGGEYGVAAPKSGRGLSIALCFPDLYEIGMSNNAIRILYRLLNELPDVSCERVFVPAPDFEAVLSEHAIPLYSLESGTPIREFDVLAFSVGYELAASGILTVLERGGVPIRTEDRTKTDPVVIAGGPAVTNPMPFTRFIDAFFIGEAEASLPSVAAGMSDVRKRGGGRDALLSILRREPSVYYPGKEGDTRRSIWQDFGSALSTSSPPVVPNIRVVQDHGVIEIMRGCPNGCRFCHAGVYYRPYRMKPPELVASEADVLVDQAGYRHITLSSLSSADYADVARLVRTLNARYDEQRVSFALPSLRVNSVNLSLLEEIASVRKSGLTFAVETPLEADQLGLNKSVNRLALVSLLGEAVRRGWRVAKFYFMIGLPHTVWEDQVDRIVEYLDYIRSNVRLKLNVNVATFVPKPHTPYQWAPQMEEEAALRDLSELKRRLKRMGIKLSYASPFHSTLEGMISRGDEGVGEIIEAAYFGGTRLDAWDEYCRRDVWNDAIDGAGRPVRRAVTSERDPDDPLPWDSIRLGTSRRYLLEEYRRSASGELTERCALECAHRCGVCNASHAVRDLSQEASPTEIAADNTTRERAEHFGPERPAELPGSADSPDSTDTIQIAYRIVFQFTRAGSARFVPHLATMGVFERSLQRAGIPVSYTEGFNPKPKLEFAQPLSLGIASLCEVAGVVVRDSIDSEDFSRAMNLALPAGFRVTQAAVSTWVLGSKTPDSLMSRYWGSRYRVAPAPTGREIGTGPDLDHLSARIEAEEGVHDFQRNGDVIEFDLESDDGRYPGVKSLLVRLLDGHPVALGFQVTRLLTYAKDDVGRKTLYIGTTAAARNP